LGPLNVFWEFLNLRLVKINNSWNIEFCLVCRYGASTAVQRVHCQRRILVNFIVEIATSYSIPITLVIGKKITFSAVGLETIA